MALPGIFSVPSAAPAVAPPALPSRAQTARTPPRRHSHVRRRQSSVVLSFFPLFRSRFELVTGLFHV